MDLTPEQTVELDDIDRLLDGMRLETDQDVLRFVPDAALLTALGRDRFAERWRTLHKDIDFEWAPLLMRRAREGCYDLDNSTGEFLAYALFDAQCFYLFQQSDASLLFGEQEQSGKPRSEDATWKLCRAFEDWFDRANDVSLDDEAADRLSVMLDYLPIPNELRLRPLLNPLSGRLLDQLPSPDRPVKQEYANWSSTQQTAHAEAEREAELVMADDKTVPDDLQHKLRRKGERFTLSDADGTTIIVERQIDKHWAMQITISGDGDDLAPPPVTAVRFGRESGVLVHPQDAGDWTIFLTPRQTREEQDAMLDLPLVIHFRSGIHLHISPGG